MRLSLLPPPPRWGRVGVGEASDDCLTPKRGFPLPDLPHVGGGVSNERSAYAIALSAGWHGSYCSSDLRDVTNSSTAPAKVSISASVIGSINAMKPRRA